MPLLRLVWLPVAKLPRHTASSHFFLQRIGQVAHHLLGMFLEFMSRDDVEQILNHNNLFLDDFLPDLDNDEE